MKGGKNIEDLLALTAHVNRALDAPLSGRVSGNSASHLDPQDPGAPTFREGTGLALDRAAVAVALPFGSTPRDRLGVVEIVENSRISRTSRKR